MIGIALNNKNYSYINSNKDIVELISEEFSHELGTILDNKFKEVEELRASNLRKDTEIHELKREIERLEEELG